MSDEKKAIKKPSAATNRAKKPKRLNASFPTDTANKKADIPQVLSEELDSDDSMKDFIDDADVSEPMPPKRFLKYSPMGAVASGAAAASATIGVPPNSTKPMSKKAALSESRSDEFFKRLMAHFESDEESEGESAKNDESEKEPDPVKTMEIDDYDLQDVSMDGPSSIVLESSLRDLASSKWDVTEEDLDAIHFFDEDTTKAANLSMPQQEPIEIFKVDPEEQVCIPSEGTEEGSVDFWWFDAHERLDGVLILFGRTWDRQRRSYVSASLAVHGMLRNIFVLPREAIVDDDDASKKEREVTFEDVRSELADLTGKHGIPRFGCRMVSRRYAFDVPDIPVEADYVKMVYEFTRTGPLVFGCRSATAC